MLIYSFFLTPNLVRAFTPQQVWVHALEQCESDGNANSKVLDSNARYSMGVAQYQLATWLSYSDEFHTTRENIFDPDLQEIVTLYILNAGGWRNWKNCSQKVVIPALGPYPIPGAVSP